MYNVKNHVTFSCSKGQMNAVPLRFHFKNNCLGKLWLSCLKDVVLCVDLTSGLKEDLEKKTIKVCNALSTTVLDLGVPVLVSFLVL